jgi:hypothetical protein
MRTRREGEEATWDGSNAVLRLPRNTAELCRSFFKLGLSNTGDEVQYLTCNDQ